MSASSCSSATTTLGGGIATRELESGYLSERHALIAVLHPYFPSTYNLADGGPERWNYIADDVTQTLLARVGDFYGGVDSNAVRALETVLPLDHEKDTSSISAGWQCTPNRSAACARLPNSASMPIGGRGST